MKSNYIVNAYKMFAGGTAMYTTYRLLEEKTDKLALDGNESILGAFTIGAGRTAISIAVGIGVAMAFTKNF